MDKDIDSSSCSGSGAAPDRAELVLVAGGDVHWSDGTHGPNVHPAPTPGPKVRLPLGKGWMRHPWVRGWKAVPCHYESLDELARITGESDAPFLERTIWNDRHGLTFASEAESVDHPFHRLRDVLSSADVAVANLEAPLSDGGRRIGFKFRAPPAFAGALARAGFDVVSTANNHAFDAGEGGLLDTLTHLKAAGVAAVGTGASLAEARRPAIIERNGIRVAFLAYSQVDNAAWGGFALADRSGVTPLDPALVKQDIERTRPDVDIVVLQMHWGFESTREVHPAARVLARGLLDHGADVILGHHPHVPAGVEVYRGKVIVYSLGNLAFAHSWPGWGDNYLARLTVSKNAVLKIEVLPVAGCGADLGQPYLLDGARAAALLADIVERSRRLGTVVRVDGCRGVIDPSQGANVATDDPQWVSFADLGRFVARKVRGRLVKSS